MGPACQSWPLSEAPSIDLTWPVPRVLEAQRDRHDPASNRLDGVNPLVGLFGAGLLPLQRSKAYHPEIDGLRVVAVIAVLINLLDPHWQPGGFLRVDISFVI